MVEHGYQWTACTAALDRSSIVKVRTAPWVLSKAIDRSGLEELYARKVKLQLSRIVAIDDFYMTLSYR